MQLVLILACFVGLVVSKVPLVAEAPLELTLDEQKPPIVADYHLDIGIPEAARIKAAEEATDFSGARIVGGSPASLGQYPFLGGLVIALITGQTSVCGSSLISNTRIVTAAHCWRTGSSQARQFTVVLGSVTLFTGGTRINTAHVIMHPNYNQNTLHNDVAVGVISWVNYSNNIRNIGLSSANNDFAGSWVWAAGFGAQWDGAGIGNNQVMHHVTMQVITNNVCRNTYWGTIIDSTLCCSTTGGRGTCGGDSGGPLQLNNELIGITSFGHVNGCQHGFPVGFARVTSFRTWILSQ